MIPTHGVATSVFLLANALRYGGQPDMATWIDTAGTRSAYLAAAIDHEPVARFLIRASLVSSVTGIHPNPCLKAMSYRADRHTLVSIAALLIRTDPPPWLAIAVVDGRVFDEFIPVADMEGLRWLGSDLEPLLLDAVATNAPRSNTLALGIGQAAELAVLSALTERHGSALHVSRISDRFGYDIEVADYTGVRRWEVKGCTARTSGTFHLSRNEFEKCRTFGKDWAVIQVEFSGDSLLAEQITAAHISGVRELCASDLLALAPVDSSYFSWETSALVTPPKQAWNPSSIRIPKDLLLPNFESLGTEVLDMRAWNGPSK